MYPPPQVYSPQAQGHGYPQGNYPPQGVGYYPQPQGYPPPMGMGYPPQGYPPQYGAPPQGQGYPPQKQKQNQAATGVMGGWYVLYLQSPYIIHRCPPSLQDYLVYIFFMKKNHYLFLVLFDCYSLKIHYLITCSYFSF